MTTSNVKVDFAIITALPEELDAVLKKLDHFETIAKETDSLLFHLGNIGNAKVLVTRLDKMGNVKSATAATIVVERYQPTYLLMVGIAAGFKGKVELGDVVVADACYYDVPGKETAKGKQPAPRQYPTNRLLYARSLDYQSLDWKANIAVKSPRNEYQPQVYHGLIASSETVISNKQRMASLLTAHRELKAVAMEGHGVAEAVYEKARFLEIRGICDFGDARKNDKWHKYAADVAAAYAVGLLRYIVPIIYPNIPSALTQKVDFAIITDLHLELEAVLSKLGHCKVLTKKSETLPFHLGNIGNAKVIVTRLDKGIAGAAIAANTVLERYQPDYLLMVGIAAGFEYRVRLGDVVVAEACYYDGLGKETVDGILHAPQQLRTSKFLYARSLDYQNMDWTANIRVPSPTDNFQTSVHHGVIACSERVIANEQRMADLLATNRQLRAVAMEGYGVAEAAFGSKVDFLEIRGICDFGDARKNDDWREYAADVAATYAVGLLHHIEATLKPQ